MMINKKFQQNGPAIQETTWTNGISFKNLHRICNIARRNFQSAKKTQDKESGTWKTDVNQYLYSSLLPFRSNDSIVRLPDRAPVSQHS
jgi:hypothetical protein